MATTFELKAVLDKIVYGGKTVGREWYFEFEFRLNSEAGTRIRRQTIGRNVPAGSMQENISIVMFRESTGPESGILEISGKVKASEEGKSEKYSESGSGKMTPLTVAFDGNELEKTLVADGIMVREYKGPKFDPMNLNVAELRFEFRITLKKQIDNPCELPEITTPDTPAFEVLRNDEIEAAEKPGDYLGGATTTGLFTLKCCIYRNEKNEYKVRITNAEGIVRWGIHTGRLMDPTVDGNSPNITTCMESKSALSQLEAFRRNDKVESDSFWFPLVGAKAHELSHVADYQKVYADKFKKIKKDLDKLTIKDLPSIPTDADIKSKQEEIAQKYSKMWNKECTDEINSDFFFQGSEDKARKAALPALDHAITRVKDYRKANKC